MGTLLIVCTIICMSSVLVAGDEYNVLVSGDSHVVVGGTLHLKAEVLDSSGFPATGTFQYLWLDNAIPKHSGKEISKNPYSFWNVTYNTDEYPPGPYNVQVDVLKDGWFGWTDIASRRYSINITLFLTGEMKVTQGSKSKSHYISTGEMTNHNIALNPPDIAFLQQKNKIQTYWFLDCEYLGVTDGLSRTWNYTTPEMTHYVEGLVVASYIPPPPPTTTTTTTTSTTTTTTTTTTSSTTTTTTSTTTTTTPKPTTTTLAPITTSSTPINNITVSDPWHSWIKNFSLYNGTDPPAIGGFCINMSSVPLSSNSTYGYFQRKLVTKAPVKIASINGTNWLKDGDVLNINVTCNGSAPFSYCPLFFNGLYNVTGNETCDNTTVTTDCHIHIGRFFQTPRQYTVVVVIYNLASKIVQPIGVNVYQAPKETQLSVIVVPITFSLVAITLIIFGVAYYLHSRRTFTVEVADFDFGQHTSDMEYKTFRERLRESIINSFYRTDEPLDNESGAGWSPSRKYGSMQ